MVAKWIDRKKPYKLPLNKLVLPSRNKKLIRKPSSDEVENFDINHLTTIGLLQLAVTWYKIRHAGEQAYYYSRTGSFKTMLLYPVKFEFSLFWMSQCGNNNKLALQHGGFCTM